MGCYLVDKLTRVVQLTKALHSWQVYQFTSCHGRFAVDTGVCLLVHQPLAQRNRLLVACSFFLVAPQLHHPLV